MSQAKVLVLRAPGTNCDHETAYAFEQAGAEAEVAHINRLMDEPKLVEQFQIMCIPGGFSFGDDIAAGRIFANQIQHRLYDAVVEFHRAGKLLLGICNGFQVLLKSGLLPNRDPECDHDPFESKPTATLTWNNSRKYEDRWVNLKCDDRACVFLRDVDSMYLPIAHAEGKFVAAEGDQLNQWQDAGQLALKYANGSGQGNGHTDSSIESVLEYPANPNGSIRNVAGMCDATGRVFGLMPHPERHIDPLQHPRWTRHRDRERGDGLAIFENAVRYFA